MNVKDTVVEIKDHIQVHAPPGLERLILEVLESPATAWFMFGVGVEALGLTVQMQFMGWATPFLDCVVGIGIGFILLWYQQRKVADDEPVDDSED